MGWEKEAEHDLGLEILGASGGQSIVERLSWGTRPCYQPEHR